MWSGSFDDGATGMAVFEAAKDEADDFFKKYDEACSDKLEYTMYGWDAMPVLSLLSGGAAPQPVVPSRLFAAGGPLDGRFVWFTALTEGAAPPDPRGLAGLRHACARCMAPRILSFTHAA